MAVFHRDSVAEEDNIQSGTRLTPNLTLCGRRACQTGNSSADQTQEGVNVTIFFEALTGGKASSHLELRNGGSTAIFYTWKKVLMPCCIPQLPLKRRTPCFYLICSSGLILPNESQQTEFIFKPLETGFIKELWQLNTCPLLTQGASFQVKLMGVAMSPDTNPFLEINLDKKVTIDMCKSIVYEMVKEIHTSERPSSAVELHICEEQEFFRKNPKLQFHSQPVEDLKRLWQMVNPGGSQDFSVDSLQQVVRSLPEESAQEKHLAHLNSLYLQLSEPSEMNLHISHLPTAEIWQLLWTKLLDDMVVEAAGFRHILGLSQTETWTETKENSQTSSTDVADNLDEESELKVGAVKEDEHESEVAVYVLMEDLVDYLFDLIDEDKM
ncbi:MYCBP-associated protein [Brachionichthys hirsutus]|uniref:MYCBP-associated protein n=1 Tax=Brachionichthys hirsutus TaxID=412623 RepID=UPI00360510E0